MEHVIWWNSTEIIVRVGHYSNYIQNQSTFPEVTMIFTRDSDTSTDYIGWEMPVWFMSDKHTDPLINRGDGIFEDIEIIAKYFEPTNDPTIDPTQNPIIEPTTDPSVNPTLHPSVNPSESPTIAPSNPSTEPTTIPTMIPSLHPTVDPSSNPTDLPTVDPTFYPLPTLIGTLSTTSAPNVYLSSEPSTNPSVSPTTRFLANITNEPTLEPTIGPSQDPSFKSTQSTEDEAGTEIEQKDGGDFVHIIMIVAFIIVTLIVIMTSLIFIVRKHIRKQNLRTLEKRVSTMVDMDANNTMDISNIGEAADIAQAKTPTSTEQTYPELNPSPSNDPKIHPLDRNQTLDSSIGDMFTNMPQKKTPNATDQGPHNIMHDLNRNLSDDSDIGDMYRNPVNPTPYNMTTAADLNEMEEESDPENILQTNNVYDDNTMAKEMKVEYDPTHVIDTMKDENEAIGYHVRMIF